MEAANQSPLNSQIPAQIYQTPVPPPGQPSKKSLIKSFLIGVLGGVIFGVGIGMLSIIVFSLIASSSGPMELEGLLVLLIFPPAAFIAGAVFFVLTLFLGYHFRAGAPLSKTISLIIQFLFILSGIGWSWFIGFEIMMKDLKDFIPIFGKFIGDNSSSSYLYVVVSIFGAAFFFMVGRLYYEFRTSCHPEE